MVKCKDCKECILVNRDKEQYGCYKSRPFKYVNANKWRSCMYFRNKI